MHARASTLRVDIKVSVILCSNRPVPFDPVENAVGEAAAAALLADRVYPCAVFQLRDSKSYWAVAPFFLGALGEGVNEEAAVDNLRECMEIAATANMLDGYDIFPDPHSAEGDADLEDTLTAMREEMSADNDKITYSSLTIFPSEKRFKRIKRVKR